MAGIAGDMVGNEDPVTDLVTGDILTDRGDFAGDLMAQDQRRFLYPVPFHDIAPADPAGDDPDQDLSGSDRRYRPLLQPDIAVVIIHGNAHCFHSLSQKFAIFTSFQRLVCDYQSSRSGR